MSPATTKISVSVLPLKKAQAMRNSRENTCTEHLSKYKTVLLPHVFVWVWNFVSLSKRRCLKIKSWGERMEATGEWGKLHNVYLQYCTSSKIIIRVIKWKRIRWTGHVARIGETRNTYKILVGRSEWNSPLERTRHKWKDNRVEVWSVFSFLRIGYSVVLLWTWKWTFGLFTTGSFLTGWVNVIFSRKTLR